MVKIESDRYAGYQVLLVSNPRVTLKVTNSLGPRVISCAVPGGENLFAVLPKVDYTHPDGQVFHFRGGHRLWTAPEVPEITYTPDNLPPNVEQLPDGLRLTQPTDPATGLQKSMTITLAQEDARVEVLHQVSNRGEQTTELAAWAITQLRTGGTAILPMETEFSDPHGLQANRLLVIWPYTDLASEHLTYGGRYLLLRSGFTEGAFKLGFPNRKGWLAYLNDGTLFVKQAESVPGAIYPDHGASSQCYCDPRFLELETLSPLTQLAPGESVSHVERWQIFEGIDLDLSGPGWEDTIDALADRLALVDR